MYLSLNTLSIYDVNGFVFPVEYPSKASFLGPPSLEDILF
jgi:hypothetical protein